MKKTCTKCDRSDVEFFKDASKKDGLRPSCKQCDSKYWKSRDWTEKQKQKRVLYSRRHAMKQYGMTLEEYDVRFQQQKGLCAICQQPDDKMLSVDHCHRSGNVRQLLCRRCNLVLGSVNDDVALLYQLISYLERHGVH